MTPEERIAEPTIGISLTQAELRFIGNLFSNFPESFEEALGEEGADWLSFKINEAIESLDA